MALRKPLVIVNGVIQQLAAGDTIATGTPIDVGIPYILPTGTVREVSVGYQYLIKGRLILQGTAILRASGQVAVI